MTTISPNSLLLRTFGKLPIIVSLMIGCGGDSRPAPKQSIVAFFSAMEASDTTRLRELVDLQSSALSIREQYTFIFEDSSGVSATDLSSTLMSSLTGDGFLRQRWTDDQKVLGSEEISGDTALVEVSFIDRVTRVQYYNKMRLVFLNGQWVITDFRTL